MARKRQSEVRKLAHGVRLLIYEDGSSLVDVPQLECTTEEEGVAAAEAITELLTSLGANPKAG